MHTRLFILCLAALLASAVTGTARAQLGFAAGLNYNRLSDIEVFDGNATFDNRSGWHAEAWLDLPLGRTWAIRPGVRYMDAGALYEGIVDDDRDLDDAFAVNLLEVPLNLRYRFNGPAVTPYVVGGPVLRFPFADDDGLNDDLRTLSLAGGLGLGLEISLGGLRLLPELAYTFGLSSFVRDEFQIAGRSFTTNDTQYLNAVMLRLGISL